jgi:hypothetical protein
MQIPIINGIYSDRNADFRTAYPRNLIPVPKQNGISQGYLRPADGIELFAMGGGVDRGGINWNGVCYRVMGDQFCYVTANGTLSVIDVIANDGEQVFFDYSFDRLAIVSAGQMFYSTGGALQKVLDVDLGQPRSVVFVDGYFMTNDAFNLVVTDLADPTSINVLKYGSAEADPDQIMRVLKLRNEPVAVGRHSIEFYTNTGGNLFPFQRIAGAMVARGSIGRAAACVFQDAIAFVGGGRNEPPAVWMGVNGQSSKISTREIDQILQSYTSEKLAKTLVETRIDSSHNMLLIHLPNQTLVYDAAASQQMEQAIWFTLDSGLLEPSAYRLRNLVWCYDKWIGGDQTSNNLGVYTNKTSSHFGGVIQWDFSTAIVYNEGRGAVFHEIELVALSGRAEFGKDPVIWTSYSTDGETWSQERAKNIGKSGERNTRISWLQQGHMRNLRVQKFRGTSDAFISFARLEARMEPLNA